MEKEIKSIEKKAYISPDIVVVQIETEQNILSGGSAPDMPGGPW